MTRAIVFAYHNVGVRCLAVLLAAGVEVPLVVTHQDNPREAIWFESVAKLAALHDIPTLVPDDPHIPEIIERIRSLAPDFLFSFYYRHVLKPELLTLARRGALNIHGSLLPKYRGRVPVNWAVIKGERETGATLHYMSEKPDQGPIVDQQAVPILPNDTAAEVLQKVTWAAEIVLHRSLPALLAGVVKAIPQDLARGAYFGARRPEDGKIDWRESAQTIHNLVRGVAPPYPGAFCTVAGRSVRVLKTLIEPRRSYSGPRPAWFQEQGRWYAACGKGVLRLVEVELEGEPANAGRLEEAFGRGPVLLND